LNTHLLTRNFFLFVLIMLASGCGSSGGQDMIYTTGPGNTSGVAVTVSPNQGPTSGGTTVTLTGPGANRIQAITIGGVAVPNFTVRSDTVISFTTPEHAPGVVDVVLDTPIGRLTLSDAFTYLAPPTVTDLEPARISTSGAMGLVLTGTGFVPGSTTVNLDGLSIVPSQATTTTLTFNAPGPCGWRGERDSDHPRWIQRQPSRRFDLRRGSDRGNPDPQRGPPQRCDRRGPDRHRVRPWFDHRQL
jgi:hypothetical protein